MSKSSRQPVGNIRASSGGASIVHDAHLKKPKKRSARVRSDRLEKEIDEDARRIEAEKAALRRIEITGGDEVELGCKSSGWPEYSELLKAKLRLLREANINQADEAADTLNKTGFKTGYGKRWTPRLINIAKIKLFGSMSDRLVSSPTESNPKKSLKS